MATRAALAVMREVAIKQINAAADRLAGVAGIEPVQIPAHSRDLEHLQAYQLDALSGWLTNLADAVAPVAEVEPEPELLPEGEPLPEGEVPAGDELPTEPEPEAKPKSKKK